MTALKRRLQSRVPNNLYWFCHRRSDADALPDWLKNHRDVRIVLPPAPPSKPDSPSASEAKLASIAAESEPTLTAQSVLDKLVGAFTDKSPALTLDPIGFFADQLTKSFPPVSTERPVEDIYTLRDVIRRVELAKEAEKKPTLIEGEIESVRDAIRRSAYLEALETASRLEAKLSTAAQREMLMESVVSAALGLNDNSEIELGGYELALRLMPAKISDPGLQNRAALALLNRGFVLNELNRREDAIQTYDQLLRRFGDTAEPALRERVASALLNKGVSLGELKRNEEAAQTYDEVLRRVGDATSPALRKLAAKALVNKGIALSELNRGEDEIQTYDEVLRRFGDATGPVVREQVAKALVYRGQTLNTLKRPQDARLSFQEVLKRFADSSDGVIQPLVEKARGGLKSLDETNS